jgi:transcriptional regulator with XRE-family HTH domain
MFSEAEIGKRIKELRNLKRMTLETLAESTGFTKGYLSKVEKNEKAPPVSTLIKIAKALQISLPEIFGEKEGTHLVSLVKKGERLQIARDGSIFGYSYESLAYKFSDKNMDPYIITLPKKAKEIPMVKHKGQEMSFVLEGKMHFIHGDREFIVEEGDCIYFDSSVKHWGAAIGNKECKCLMVIYSPT